MPVKSDVRAAAAAPAIEMRGLSFSYAGAEAPVLRDLSWRVERGAFALLVGGTGSGKSTLLSLCKPEIAPAGTRTGSIEVLGAPVETLDTAASARSVGYVFQNPENQIVCESVWHELAFGLENLGTPQGEMRRLIAETSYFFGIDDWFRSDTATLSGGRKQLLALASTLVMQPRVLLLDEPTAQLDPVAEKNFLHALFRVHRELGCTVIVATHRPQPMVDYATCAFELADGRVSQVASLAALREQPRIDVADVAGQSGRSSSSANEKQGVAVELCRTWFRYGRREPWIVRNMDLAVREGCIHALVGGNGCGKSTLLALMAGVQRLQRGTLRVASEARVLLPQDPRALFMADTVHDELMEWAARGVYDEADAMRALERVGLSGSETLHPYDLSGGQQQLLALAKLLLLKPRLLLLDEPTKGLDIDARRRVAAVLRALRADGVTVVMASHDLDFVQQMADEISMVFDGEVACTAPREEFFQGNVYYRP